MVEGKDGEGFKLFFFLSWPHDSSRDSCAYPVAPGEQIIPRLHRRLANPIASSNSSLAITSYNQGVSKIDEEIAKRGGQVQTTAY